MYSNLIRSDDTELVRLYPVVRSIEADHLWITMTRNCMSTQPQRNGATDGWMDRLFDIKESGATQYMPTVCHHDLVLLCSYSQISQFILDK